MQVYPVLSTEEASSVDDAAVKLLMDWVDHRPALPEDPAIHAQYKKDMARGADHACKLLEALCTKRTALIERLWSLYLEEGQDEFVKACSSEPQPCYALQVPFPLQPNRKVQGETPKSIFQYLVLSSTTRECALQVPLRVMRFSSPAAAGSAGRCSCGEPPVTTSSGT